MSDHIATVIKDVSENFTGTAKLDRLDPPIEYDQPWDDDDPPAKTSEFVVASATSLAGVEAYIFPADESGAVLSYGELEGSAMGILDCDQAIRNAGYEIKEAGDV